MNTCDLKINHFSIYRTRCFATVQVNTIASLAEVLSCRACYTLFLGWFRFELYLLVKDVFALIILMLG